MATMTKNFVLAGRAVFTVEVPEDFRTNHKKKYREDVNPHYTFRVRYKAAEGNYKEAYFVQLLTGPDNTQSYSYLGMMDKVTGDVRITAKSCRPKGHVCVLLVRRVLARIWENQTEAIEKAGFRLHHEGRCGRCGRALTTPESVDRGIGPECWEYMGMAEKVKERDKVDRKKWIDADIERVLAESERLELEAQAGNFGEETDPWEDREPDPSLEAEDRALNEAYRRLSEDFGPYGQFRNG